MLEEEGEEQEERAARALLDEMTAAARKAASGHAVYCFPPARWGFFRAAEFFDEIPCSFRSIH